MLGLIIAAAGGAFLASRALRPINIMTHTTNNIVETRDLSRRLNYRGPQDEVGRLAMTFDRMLDQIEALFQAQQRFIADVSHELRTPLTTIRGYLDLFKRAHIRQNEAEQAEILATVEEELSRMTRLVADLLLLAQADSGVTLELSLIHI